MPSSGPGREGEDHGAPSPAPPEVTAHACRYSEHPCCHARYSQQSLPPSHSACTCHPKTCAVVPLSRICKRKVRQSVCPPHLAELFQATSGLSSTHSIAHPSTHPRSALLYLTHISQAGSFSTLLPVACLISSTEVVLAWFVHASYLSTGCMPRPHFWTCTSVCSHDGLGDYLEYVTDHVCSHG